ncbi:hypothetical protein ON010_g18116 [Phytophthora cinnamomi]|nr:hypothetical protein ON010_g18116 [Phytophthora cinnamomi]
MWIHYTSRPHGRSEGSYEIEYRPTLHSESPIEDRLTISFVELGEYTYNLVLTTQSVGPERILYFKAPLGGSQTQTFTFTSYAEAPTELSCSVQDPTSFSAPAVCKVEGSPSWEGKPESILIKFEPEAIGEFRDTLALVSDSVGEYKCTLQGLSVPPLPQGPYVFSTSKDIEFKNVFSTPKDFEIMVDNPRFVVSTTSMSLPAKSSRAITVKIDRPPSSARGEKLTQGGASETGKLSARYGGPRPRPPRTGAPPDEASGRRTAALAPAGFSCLEHRGHLSAVRRSRKQRRQRCPPTGPPLPCRGRSVSALLPGHRRQRSNSSATAPPLGPNAAAPRSGPRPWTRGERAAPETFHTQQQPEQ